MIGPLSNGQTTAVLFVVWFIGMAYLVHSHLQVARRIRRLREEADRKRVQASGNGREEFSPQKHPATKEGE